MNDQAVSVQNIDLSIVVPIYREEKNIRPFLDRTEKVLRSMNVSYEIIFCLDPSPDNTEKVVIEEIKRNHNIKLFVLSRRFGQPAATMTGILNCSGDTCVVIDVDLQDPPELITDLYKKLKEGYEVVYAKRSSRKGETLAKIIVSYLGYKVINAMADVDIPRNTGDFRIMTRRVIEELRKLNEGHGFLRGLVAFVGFKQSFVEYERDKRDEGRSNYNKYIGSIKIGLNGVIGFSNFLLSLMVYMGLAICTISIMLVLFVVITKLFFFVYYPVGTATIISLILFMGGVQMLAIGIVGEYIGRIYNDVRHRPMYIIEKTVTYSSLSTKQNK